MQVVKALTPSYRGTIYIPITAPGVPGWTEEDARLEFEDVTVVGNMLVCHVDGELSNPIHDWWFPPNTVFDLTYKGVV